MTDHSALKKLTKARARLIISQPFFGTLALKLALKEDWTKETMSVNGKQISYNPEFVHSLELPQLCGVVAHEVMHCANKHHTRRGDRDPELWNIAGDYAINGLLVQAGFELTEGALIDPQYDGMAAERIYKILHQQAQQQQQQQSGDGDGEGEGDDQQQCAGNDDQGDGDGENKTQDPGGMGGVEDAPSSEGSDADGEAATASPEEMAEEEREWQVAMAQAAQVAKKSGTLPGDIARMIEDHLNERLDWRALLARFLTEQSRDDYSWSRPNRRHIADGLYLPSLHSETVGKIVIAIDTSGSVCDEEVSQFQAEINGLIGDLCPEEVHVIYCDYRIRGAEVFGPDDYPIRMKARGGGGTLFSPVFQHIEALEIEPACLVYMTDLDPYQWDVEEPEYPVLWLDTFGHPDLQAAVPFGEVVTMQV